MVDLDVHCAVLRYVAAAVGDCVFFLNDREHKILDTSTVTEWTVSLREKRVLVEDSSRHEVRSSYST